MFVLALSLYNTWNRGVFLLCKITNLLIYRYYNKIPDIEVLTEREIEILRAICKGDIKKKIAKNLFISERTLYNHIQNIYDKLEVSNTVEAYNKAIKLGYIEPLM